MLCSNVTPTCQSRNLWKRHLLLEGSYTAVLCHEIRVCVCIWIIKNDLIIEEEGLTIGRSVAEQNEQRNNKNDSTNQPNNQWYSKRRPYMLCCNE